MKKFIFHIGIFTFISLLSMFYVLSMIDGRSDPFYLKISSPKQSNLILGTSKAAQGLQPAVFNKILGKEFFNYSFAIYLSPYGDTYLRSVKNKLDRSGHDNIYILTIDAWSISSVCNDPNDSLAFREKISFLESVENVNAQPNFKYLINWFYGNYYEILVNNSPAFLHNDGWIEVSLNNDENKVKLRTKFTIKDYSEKVKRYRYSGLRYAYFLKTITFLKEYGKVYIVRLPVHPDMMNIENKIIADLDSKISAAIQNSDGYLDMSSSNGDYRYTDGVHPDKESGEKVSAAIADWIKSLK